MEREYTFEISFNTEDSVDSFKPENPRPNEKWYNATLKIINNEIFIIIPYKPEFYRGFSNWKPTINWNKFGSYIEINNAKQNPGVIDISFKEAKLLGNSYENSVTLKVDWVRIDLEPDNEETDTGVFYLNDAGFKFVHKFYNPIFPNIDNNYKPTRRGEDYYSIEESNYRPEFEYDYSDSVNKSKIKIVKNPFLKFNYKNILENNSIHFADVVCRAVSFYYERYIDYSFARICLSKKKIIIKKTLPQQIGYSDLGISRLMYIGNSWGIHKFLSSNWHIAFISHYTILSKSINNYLHANIVEGSSTFLILYSIIEFIKSAAPKKNKVNDKFNIIASRKEMKGVCNVAYTILLKLIPKNEYPEFEKKWVAVIGNLKYKTMKSIIEELFIENQLNCDEFPIKIERLIKIRNYFVHGGKIEIEQEELDKANYLLYEITAILILNLMGINDWNKYRIKE